MSCEREEYAQEDPEFTLCGYSNCFRPFYKMRGFMPCCELHYKHPKKWPKDKDGNPLYTGSIWVYGRKGEAFQFSVNEKKEEK